MFGIRKNTPDSEAEPAPSRGVARKGSGTATVASPEQAASFQYDSRNYRPTAPRGIVAELCVGDIGEWIALLVDDDIFSGTLISFERPIYSHGMALPIMSLVLKVRGHDMRFGNISMDTPISRTRLTS